MACASSSSGSTNTLSFGSNSSLGSPCSLEMDHILQGFINGIGLNGPTCVNCEDRTEATSRCTDCTELLCDPCVRAHQRVRLTKDHRIERFFGNGTSKLLSSPTTTIDSTDNIDSPPPPPSAPAAPSAIISKICDMHHEPHRLFCDTCVLFICTACATTGRHSRHRVLNLQEAMAQSSAISSKLMQETRTALFAIKRAMEGVQVTSAKIELSMFNSKSEVQNFIRRSITALERREHDLIGRIEEIRRMKNTRLMYQMDTLRLAYTKLVYISNVLNETQSMPNSIELMTINENVSNQLKAIRPIKSELYPCEDDNVCFMGPDASFHRALLAVGSVGIPEEDPTRAALDCPTVQSTRNLLRIPDMTVFDSTPSNHHQHHLAPILEDSETMSQATTRTNAPSNAKNICRPIYNSAEAIAVSVSVPAPSLVFGAEGGEEGQLCRPWGVCCDRLGRIVVADRSNNRIQVFDQSGNFLYTFGTLGKEPGQLDRPAGVAINPDGEIVVADKDNHRIQIFRMDGTFVLTFGEKGSRCGQFNYPWDVACNAQGQIVVSDTRNHRIQLFNRYGEYINKFGYESNNSQWRSFDSPRGLAFTPNGSIVVTDFNNHRLAFIDAHLTNAEYVGHEGANARQFLRPQGVVCDDDGNIIVADSKNERIQVLDHKGQFRYKFGRLGKMPGELDRPSGICLNPEGKIVVVDFGNSRIQLF